MSLRDNNKGKGLVVTSNGGVKKTYGAVARPDASGLETLNKLAVRDVSTATKGRGRIGFIVDATASRGSNWVEAQDIQASMFREVSAVGTMQLRLVHFGGGTTTAHEWKSNLDDVAADMKRVSCMGGATQIVESLRSFDDANEMTRASSIIVIGDSFEENLGDLEEIAKKLASQKIKIFTFLDGDDASAEKAFQSISQITGGAFAKFGANMPLKDLCEGVALLSVGGAQALQRLKNPQAKTLLLTAQPK